MTAFPRSAAGPFPGRRCVTGRPGRTRYRPARARLSIGPASMRQPGPETWLPSDWMRNIRPFSTLLARCPETSAPRPSVAVGRLPLARAAGRLWNRPKSRPGRAARRARRRRAVNPPGAPRKPPRRARPARPRIGRAAASPRPRRKCSQRPALAPRHRQRRLAGLPNPRRSPAAHAWRLRRKFNQLQVRLNRCEPCLQVRQHLGLPSSGSKAAASRRAIGLIRVCRLRTTPARPLRHPLRPLYLQTRARISPEAKRRLSEPARSYRPAAVRLPPPRPRLAGPDQALNARRDRQTLPLGAGSHRRPSAPSPMRRECADWS